MTFRHLPVPSGSTLPPPSTMSYRATLALEISLLGKLLVYVVAEDLVEV